MVSTPRQIMYRVLVKTISKRVNSRKGPPIGFSHAITMSTATVTAASLTWTPSVVGVAAIIATPSRTNIPLAVRNPANSEAGLRL